MHSDSAFRKEIEVVFSEDLALLLHDLRTTKFIMGDVNTTPSSADRTSSTSVSEKYRCFIHSHQLVDHWTHFYPRRFSPTFRYLGGASRIDVILMTPNLFSKFSGINHLRHAFSDCAMVFPRRNSYKTLTVGPFPMGTYRGRTMSSRWTGG